MSDLVSRAACPKMDERLSRGFVRADSRGLETAIGSERLTALFQTLAEKTRPRFSRQRRLSGEELKALMAEADAMVAGFRPIMSVASFCPGTKARPKSEAYENRYAFVTSVEDSKGKCLYVYGLRTYGTRKRFAAEVTETETIIYAHAIERGLQRGGVDAGQVYDVGRSPIRAVALSLLECAGIIPCIWARIIAAATQLNGPVIEGSIALPGPNGGLLLGVAQLPLDPEIIRRDPPTAGSELVSYKDGALSRQGDPHPLAPNGRPRVVIKTFVDSGSLYPEQTQIRARLVEFMEEHSVALTALRYRLLWHRGALDVPAATPEQIEAAHSAFAPISIAAADLRLNGDRHE
jgi:hypothetical protein